MGAIMNSWMSTLESAWEPPLRMFIMGTGRTWALGPPTYWNRSRPADSAEAWAAARETPRMALAPSLPLLGVPSSSIMSWSRPRWSAASKPMISGAMMSLTLSTAFSTPLPP